MINIFLHVTYTVRLKVYKLQGNPLYVLFKLLTLIFNENKVNTQNNKILSFEG